MSKHKLQIHHLAILQPLLQYEATRKRPLLPRKGELVALFEHNPRPQLDEGKDVWLVRFIDSDDQDLEDRGHARECELVSLLDLSKGQLGKELYKLEQRFYGPVPEWVESHIKSKMTKAELVEWVEKLWQHHAVEFNRKKQIEKEAIKREKEDREYLLESFRIMNPVSVGIYLSMIVEQLTDEQVKVLVRQISKDEREKYQQEIIPGFYRRSR